MEVLQLEINKEATKRLVGGVGRGVGWSHTHVWGIKIRKDISAMEAPWGVRGPSPTPGPLTQGSCDRKISPHNFWLEIPAGMEAKGDIGLLESQAVPLKGPAHGFTQLHSLWAPALGQQLERKQGHIGRNWIVWHQGESWGRGQLSARQKY